MQDQFKKLESPQAANFFWLDSLIAKLKSKNYYSDRMTISLINNKIKNSLLQFNNELKVVNNRNDYSEIIDYVVNVKEKTEYFSDKTSGTSGRPGTVLRHSQSILLEFLRFSAVLCYYGINIERLKNKIGVVYVSHYPDAQDYIFFEEVLGTNILKCNLNRDESVREVIKMQESISDDYILAGSATSILNAINNQKLCSIKKPNLCIVSGESLLPQVKRKIQSFYECPIRQLYTMREFGMIGFECIMIKNKFHVCDDMLDVESKNGEILISDYSNQSFIIENYDTNDYGVITSHKECTCGLYTSSLEKFRGRMQQFIVLHENKIIDLGVVAKVLEKYKYLTWYTVQLDHNGVLLVDYHLSEMKYCDKFEKSYSSRITCLLDEQIEISWRRADNHSSKLGIKLKSNNYDL